MTTVDSPPPQGSSAWNWPAEWAVERAFWREVAARTIAGVLAVLVLAIPGLIYAGVLGVLTRAQVAPILIGIGLLFVVILVYVGALTVIRRHTAKKIERAIKRENPRSKPLPARAQLIGISAEELRLILNAYMHDPRGFVRGAQREARILSVLATAIATVGAAAAALVPIWLR